MRHLWQQTSGGPITEADIEAAVEAVAGRSLRKELQAWVHGVDDLPLERLLPAMGIELRDEAAAGLPAQLGLKLSEGPFSGVQVKSVLRGSAAERAGLSPGDEIFAVQGWRVRRLDDALAWLAAGETLELLVVRDQRVLTLRVAPPEAKSAPRAASLVLAEKAPKAAVALRRAWLQG
jgi:predicted metalloprotease with PDZ domain